MENTNQEFRIYGDNILECEEALRLITVSLEAEAIPLDGPLFVPRFRLVKNNKTYAEIKLFPGYDRWEYDLKKVMEAMGAKLREATDAVITKIIKNDTFSKEIPILALEFSGALPAGNNAWQRCGRALSCAQSHIPYLYFAELGGVELGENRKVKAPRFPNPIVPFAYLSLGKRYNSVTLPIYQPSPSISEDLFHTFKPYFAGNEVNQYVKSILLGKEDSESKKQLEQKALSLTEFLASKRKNKDAILSPNEWEGLYKVHESSEVASWLIEKSMEWRKKVSIPTTSTFAKLLSSVSELKVNAVGSKEMPFCLLSDKQRLKFTNLVSNIYKNKIDNNFYSWLNNQKPLFIVWVAGFKPRGDDSRPDRGLVPLLRMVVGEDDVDVLTVVYGPSKKEMLVKLKDKLWDLARENGLWQAVLNYSNALIVDTRTSQELKSIGIIPQNPPHVTMDEKLFVSTDFTIPHKYGEHDVDSVLHEIFYLHKDDAFFEGLCNPPGGNWSGISLFNFNTGVELRWVSLPRVSGEKAKRPDHLFQIMTNGTSNLITVESKENSISVEKNIGEKLKKYIAELIKISPNIFRTKEDVTWKIFSSEYLSPNVNILSVAAFRYISMEDLHNVKERSEADVVFGVEFENEGRICLHLLLNKREEWLATFLGNRTKHFNGWLKIKVH